MGLETCPDEFHRIEVFRTLNALNNTYQCWMFPWSFDAALKLVQWIIFEINVAESREIEFESQFFVTCWER